MKKILSIITLLSLIGCGGCDSDTSSQKEVAKSTHRKERIKYDGAPFQKKVGKPTKSEVDLMMHQGRQLVTAILMRGIKTNHFISIWPRIESLEEVDEEDADIIYTKIDEEDADIYTKSYSKSTDYFKDLFDVKNQQSSDYAPYVDCKIDCLWGAGVLKSLPGQLTSDNVAWTILAGANDVHSGGIPALVSRNVDTSLFPVSGSHDMSQKRDKVRLFDIPPFGTHGAVIVTKDGAARYISAKDGTIPLCEIYEKAPMVKIPQVVKLKYLHP